ncbi:DnaJ-domain-containing protein [Nadsonia fulvescens var. elongata DSM 6958]|uniref:DnaJ-domain-containing protein n=1 Tax=Nadsonia fulvescens var. elongata DSM 6958 TaxID=857566 RepID=A0A1E3PT44_9ASCO|nr:DnaJ-domain-containing protein [Nadsonia fulvescens var. elongata DSM 6958]
MSDTLPQLPSGWTAPEAFASFGSFTAPNKRAVEPVGPAFLAHARRTLHGRTWSEDEKIQAQENVIVADVVEEESEDEEGESEELLNHSARDWKTLDLYGALGLKRHRWRADEDKIRKAHRKSVLKHHPDKKAGQQDGFFKCIQKAFEILMDPTKRKQFDSVDSRADVLPPTKFNADNFIELWGPVFEAEGRFSRVQPVPKIGTMESPKEEVNKFYSFFYALDSWRTFEFLDEDVPDDTSNRDNKRYIEKKNFAARKKRKTEELARLRKLIDTAIASDPRIKLFKENEKAAKEKAKWDREADTRKAAEDAKKAAEEAAAAKEAEEKAAKEAKEGAKKNKEAAKNAKKKNKRTIRGSVKDVGYFGESSAAQIDAILSDVDALIEKFDDLELSEVAGKLAGVTDASTVKSVFTESATKHAIPAKFFA